MGCVRPGIFADCIPNRHLTRIKPNNSTIIIEGRFNYSVTYWLFILFLIIKLIII